LSRGPVAYHWAFDDKAMEGEKVDPWVMVVTGFMTKPKPFRLRLVPRGQCTEKDVEKVMGGAADVEA
jgi:hypothetical protein